MKTRIGITAVLMMVVLVVSVQHTCDELESTVPSDILDDDDDVVVLWSILNFDFLSNT